MRPAMTTWPLTLAKPLSTPTRLRSRCTRASITTESPGSNRTAIPHALDAAEEDQLSLVLGLREDQHGADLRHRFGQDRRRQRRAAGPVPAAARSGVTFLMPTMRVSTSNSVMRSTSRNG